MRGCLYICHDMCFWALSFIFSLIAVVLLSIFAAMTMLYGVGCRPELSLMKVIPMPHLLSNQLKSTDTFAPYRHKNSSKISRRHHVYGFAVSASMNGGPTMAMMSKQLVRMGATKIFKKHKHLMPPRSTKTFEQGGSQNHILYWVEVFNPNINHLAAKG